METLALIGDGVGLAGFLAAALVTIATPAAEDSSFNMRTKGAMLAAFGTYVYVTTAKLLEARLQDSYLYNFDDYIEVLFPVLVLLAVYEAFSHQQLMDLERSRHALRSAHDMTLEIVDAASVGIMLLDTRGHIAFANDTARAFLDLTESADTGEIITPGWTVRCGSCEETNDFVGLLRDGRTQGIPVAVVWPKGWRIDLKVSLSPLTHDDGVIGGYVASFERPSRM